MILWWQILLLTLYSAINLWWVDNRSSAGSPVFAGFITGLIMGDVTTGLFIGGSLQLFVLGVGTFGGASYRRNFWCGSCNSILYLSRYWYRSCDHNNRCTSSSTFDILRRSWTYDNYFLCTLCDAAIERFDYKCIERNHLLVQCLGLFLVPSSILRSCFWWCFLYNQ